MDIVACDLASQKAIWMVEVKWSDRFYANPAELSSVIEFVQKNGLSDPLVTTYSKAGKKKVRDVEIRFTPCSLYCYTVGKKVVAGVSQRLTSQ